MRTDINPRSFLLFVAFASGTFLPMPVKAEDPRFTVDAGCPITMADVTLEPLKRATATEFASFEVVLTMGGAGGNLHPYYGVAKVTVVDGVDPNYRSETVYVVPDLIFANYFGRYRIGVFSGNIHHTLYRQPSVSVRLHCSKIPDGMLS